MKQGAYMPSVTRVLVVDDSPLVCEVLSAILREGTDFEVIGTASNGVEAAQMVSKHRPDIVTMDLNMPVMDGFEATAAIMQETPTPILILSSSIDSHDVINTMKSLSAGALDVMEKPAVGLGWQRNAETLRKKIKMLAGLKVFPLSRTNRGKVLTPPKPVKTEKSYSIIGIGVSTGGPNVLREILQPLPENFSPGIVVVQHITVGFTQGLADWLDSTCRVKVKVAEDGEVVRNGTVYIAPDSFHIRVSPAKKIQYDASPAVGGHKPAADVLLKSIAASCGPSGVGIILTGMGRDGAEGIRMIKQAGGYTIAQNQESCVVFGMPRVAIEMGCVDKVLSDEGIMHELMMINKASHL